MSKSLLVNENGSFKNNGWEQHLHKQIMIKKCKFLCHQLAAMKNSQNKTYNTPHNNTGPGIGNPVQTSDMYKTLGESANDEDGNNSK
jgi:hypothetical protein